MRKRLLSLLLVACMVLPMIPVMGLSVFAADGTGTYSTNFSADPTNPNFPTLDLPAKTDETVRDIGGVYSYDDVETGVKVLDLVTFNGNWEIGAFPVDWNSTTGAVTMKAGFTPYNILRRDSASDIAIYDGHGTWGSSSDGRGGALFMDSALEWVLSFGMNYGGNGDRYVKNYYATSGIRYTAEYTGVIDITAALAFFAANGTDVAVLHNTEVVAVIENDGTAVKGNNGENVDFGEVVSDLAVRTGDTIAFVNVGDSSYDQDVSGFNYNNTKRGFRNFDFTITYEEGYYKEEVEIWDGASNTNIVRNATSNTDPNLYFFAWYTADGTRLLATQKPDATSYAVVNPYLIENEIVAADDTYAEAMEKYRDYLKGQTYIEYNGNWSFGSNQKGNYSAFMYPSYLDQKNPYMVRANSSGVSLVAEFGSSRWVSEASFDTMFNSFYAASWQGNTTKNATIPQEDTLLADIRISYTTDLHPSGAEGNGKAWAPTSVAAVAGIEAKCYTPAELANVFYVRARTKNTSLSNLDAASFAYTASKAGVLELTVNAVSFYESNAEAQWALMINGELVTEFATITNKNGSNPADAINAALAEIGEIGVCKGDRVEFVFARDTANGGRHIAMNITSVLNDSRVPVRYESGDKVLQSTIVKKGEALPALVGYDAFGVSGYMINGVYATELPATVEDGLVIADFFINSSASLTIAGDFAINVYVEGGETVTGAGVVVDGIRQAGVLQPDGTYKVTVATIAAKDLLTTNVNYLSYQYHNDGTYRLSRAFTKLESAAMLEAYTNGSMGAAVKEVAQSVVDYAYIADIYFNGKVLGGSDPVKNRLKGALTIVKGQNGYEYTDYNSGAYDVMLATLKMYSVDGYVPAYTNAYSKPAGKETVDFVPWADFLKSDRVEWGFGDQNPTDSAYKFAINAVTLNLAEKIGFALSIQANGEGSLDDLVAGGNYKLKVCIGGGIVEYYDAFLYVDETKSAKALLVDGVPTGFFDQDYEFTVVEETEDGYVDVSATLTYGVDAWCVENYQFCAGAVKDYLLKAIYRMGIAADAYLRS